MIDKVLELSEDQNLPIYNDWSYGYWLWSKGYKTPNNPGTGLDNNYQGKGLYLTSNDMNCLLVSEKKEIARKETKIWHCN